MSGYMDKDSDSGDASRGVGFPGGVLGGPGNPHDMRYSGLGGGGMNRYLVPNSSHQQGIGLGMGMGMGMRDMQDDFAIQNEDFPALPGSQGLGGNGGRGGGDGLSLGSHGHSFQSDGQNLGSVPLHMQQQQPTQMQQGGGVPMGAPGHLQGQQRGQGQALPPQAQQQQQQRGQMGDGGAGAGAATQSWSQSQPQPQGAAGAATGGRPSGGVGSGQDQQQQQQQQQQQPETAATSKEVMYGLLGLLQMQKSDKDLNTLAAGVDLLTLGLNLNSPDPLYSLFASPFADQPTSMDAQYVIPQCYLMHGHAPQLRIDHFQKYKLETLFYMFYTAPHDFKQAYAAQELYRREWRYHGELLIWIKPRSAQELMVGHPTVPFLYFDVGAWEARLFSSSRGDLLSGLLSEEDVRVKLPQQGQGQGQGLGQPKP